MQLKTTAEAVEVLRGSLREPPCAAVLGLGGSEADTCWPLLGEFCEHPSARRTFTVLFDGVAAEDVKLRLRCFREGARMVSSSTADLQEALRQVAAGLASGGPYVCPLCGLGALSEEALREHVPLYHGSEPDPRGAACPICAEACSLKRTLPLVVHLKNKHGSLETREPPHAPFPAFSWVVCRRRDGRFLLVNEPAGLCDGSPDYWLPAGRVDVGESLVEAAMRECLEEAGIRVRVTGVLKLVSGPQPIRVVFLAEPEAEDLGGGRSGCEPKSVPDFESIGAVWVRAEDLAKLEAEDYRNLDPAWLYPAVADGTLRPHSLDDEPFRALDAAVQRLTLGDSRALKELPATWERAVAWCK